MKGILLDQPGGDYHLVDNLDKPKPGPKQVLVKSLCTCINPVEGFMQSSGMMVVSFPIVLGCDASGTVTEVGSEITKFKPGDGVFGCTRLGHPGYSTFQEYFLMDENLTFKRPSNVSVEQAATIGVGLLTACLGLISGTKISLEQAEGKDEWVIILGAAGSVGQYAVKVAKLCGYKVLASCSPANDKLVKSIGADATFNYRIPLAEQLKDIESITGGKYSCAFDASAVSAETGMEAFAKAGGGGVKYFATTNDWMPIEEKEGIEIYKVTLGVIGRSGDAHITEVNQDIEGFIPKLEKFLADGAMKPMEYEVVDGVGVDAVLKGLEVFNARKSGEKKVLVKIAED